MTTAMMAHSYDILIRGGDVYDGGGGPAQRIDVGIIGDRLALLGDAGAARASIEIDAAGLAVSPGFINMLSWAGDDLLVDGRSQSDIRQGVTLEVMGEGVSMGPMTEAMKQEDISRQGDIRYDIPWTTLGEFLAHLVARGVSTNVASFVGATTVRVHELGYANRLPTSAELNRMCELVRQAMREGAMGLASSLIYAPAAYADTAELIALARAAGEFGGMYISHLRNEADSLLEAFDEFISIARQANVPAEVYHLKASGRTNWNKSEALLDRIDDARAEGLSIT
ncbi:MAG: D-aminoacylase, partial [Phycisphaerae bacterium]|nr:D-aminoacylase [Phycisphaerae bacterium]